MIEKELAIVGAGIAGVSSAVYAKRAGLDFLLFESQAIGGQLLLVGDVDNYVGLKADIKGSDLSQRLIENLKCLKISPVYEEISKIEVNERELLLYTPGSSYKVKGLIIATGASHKKLKVKGEDLFSGKGVSYCAVCDGFFFKGKKAGVVGGGNTAAEEALYLSRLCEKVYLIHRRDKLRALHYLIEELNRRENVEIIFNSVIKEVRGENILKEVVIENTINKEISSLSLEGLFIAVGIKPHTDIFSNIAARDKEGFIVTDEEMKTSCDFIWACGDCRRRPLRQLVTAASEGAVAALSAYKYLRGHYISS